jgi:hypothetical protein
MTQDEIIEMARQAGLLGGPVFAQGLERFAKLVAEKVADGVSKHAETHRLDDIEIAVAAEREACAKVCEELVIEVVGNSALAVDQCARTIRARCQQ